MSVNSISSSTLPDRSGFLTPPPRATADQVRSPDPNHYAAQLLHSGSPAQRYIARKPIHTVISPHLSSPLDDARKIRSGDAVTETQYDRTVYKIKSATTGLQRTYQRHLDGNSERIVPYQGPDFLRMRGNSVIEELGRLKTESEASQTSEALWRRLKEREQLDERTSRLKPALRSPLTTCLSPAVRPESPASKLESPGKSALQFVPRIIRLRSTPSPQKQVHPNTDSNGIGLENHSRKTPSSSENPQSPKRPRLE